MVIDIKTKKILDSTELNIRTQCKPTENYNPNPEYLDESPALDSVLKDFLQDLEPMYDEGYCNGITALECRRRGGFIPHSHNRGGYDKYYMTDLFTFLSTGYDLCKGYGADEAEAERLEAYNTWKKHDMSDEAKKALKDIPEDKWNYPDLCDLGLDSIAEELDEYEREWLSSTIWYGYRAMYEGKSGSWHTIVLYCIASNCEYRGFSAGDTIKEFEIKFRNPKELKGKLEALVGDVRSVF